MKSLVFTFLFSFITVNAQTISLVNSTTKEVELFKKVNSWYDGSVMTLSKVDNTIYKSINGVYYKKVISSDFIPQLFGAKGDSKYRVNDGDPNELIFGTDDTKSLNDFFKSRKKTENRGNHVGGSSLFFPQSIYKSYGGHIIDDHNTLLIGDGSGISIIHAISNNTNTNQPLILFGKTTKSSSWDNLLTGGGIERMSLRTNNKDIRNYGVKLDFVEYMTFRDLNMEGFGKSAFLGNFWESYFENIKISASGALQEVDEKGVPILGLIDTTNPTGIKNLSNNTLFNKLTFSSCFGTWIKLTASTAQTSNMNIHGFSGETYYGNAGKVDNQPIIYVSNAIGNSINGGFITVNSTNVERNATIVEMNSTSELKLSNFSITFNPIKDDLGTRPIRRLRSIADLKSDNSKLILNDVTIYDQVDGIGFNLDSTPSLIEGKGISLLTNVIFNLKSENIGGTRRLTNFISRGIKASGNVLVIPADLNGELPSQKKTLEFTDGKITVYQNKLPTAIDTWAIGDKIIKVNSDNILQTGWYCISPGTSGDLKGRLGTTNKNSRSLNINDSSLLLIGDWIKIEGIEEYNRISDIKGKLITLEQAVMKSVINSKITFHKPQWKEISIK